MKYFLNSNKEPIADWINSEKKFGEYSIKLDGEKINGNAIFASIRRIPEIGDHLFSILKCLMVLGQI